MEVLNIYKNMEGSYVTITVHNARELQDLRGGGPPDTMVQIGTEG